MNIAELLKDCPKGMELDCTMWSNCTYYGIEDIGYINILIKTPSGVIKLSKEGCFIHNCRDAKCVIFPKGKTTWEGFQRPFKDGDVVAVTMIPEGIWIGIFKQYEETSFESYCYLNTCGEFCSTGSKKHSLKGLHLATEEEKQKLFDAIKEHGYKWNPEIKTLEKLIKPKFKVGDRITDKNKFIYRITEITDKGYKLHDLKTTFITFEEADLYFVKVVDIFDINTLIPFESRVLVRSSYGDIWRPAIYGFTDSNKYYVVGGIYWIQCIPFEPNKELLGATNDCDDFYKTWE